MVNTFFNETITYNMKQSIYDIYREVKIYDKYKQNIGSLFFT